MLLKHLHSTQLDDIQCISNLPLRENHLSSRESLLLEFTCNAGQILTGEPGKGRDLFDNLGQVFHKPLLSLKLPQRQVFVF